VNQVILKSLQKSLKSLFLLSVPILVAILSDPRLTDIVKEVLLSNPKTAILAPVIGYLIHAIVDALKHRNDA